MKLLVRLFSAMLIAGCAAAAHAAPINVIYFSGSGVVTYNVGGDGGYGGGFFTAPVNIGDPVNVTGKIRLGDGTNPLGPPATPAGFTGTVALDPNAIYFNAQGFDYNVAGGYSGANTLVVPIVYVSAVITLSYGRLTGLQLSLAGDPEYAFLDASGPSGNGRFGEIWGYTGVPEWGGTWRLNEPLPEPATWAMMLAGFFGLGAILRGARPKHRPTAA